MALKIGKNLRKALKAKGWKQKDLAEKTGHPRGSSDIKTNNLIL